MAGSVNQKHLFERGQKGVFGLYSGLKNLNEKVAENGDNSELISFMAAAVGFEPSRSPLTGLHISRFL
jgi:hypothetical protein